MILFLYLFIFGDERGKERRRGKFEGCGSERERERIVRGELKLRGSSHERRAKEAEGDHGRRKVLIRCARYLTFPYISAGIPRSS